MGRWDIFVNIKDFDLTQAELELLKNFDDDRVAEFLDELNYYDSVDNFMEDYFYDNYYINRLDYSSFYDCIDIEKKYGLNGECYSTLDAAKKRLDQLKELGYTHLDDSMNPIKIVKLTATHKRQLYNLFRKMIEQNQEVKNNTNRKVLRKALETKRKEIKELENRLMGVE